MCLINMGIQYTCVFEKWKGAKEGEGVVGSKGIVKCGYVGMGEGVGIYGDTVYI